MEMRKEDKHIKKSFQDILEEIGENQCSKYTRARRAWQDNGTTKTRKQRK